MLNMGTGTSGMRWPRMLNNESSLLNTCFPPSPLYRSHLLIRITCPLWLFSGNIIVCMASRITKQAAVTFTSKVRRNLSIPSPTPPPTAADRPSKERQESCLIISGRGQREIYLTNKEPWTHHPCVIDQNLNRSKFRANPVEGYFHLLLIRDITL